MYMEIGIILILKFNGNSITYSKRRKGSITQQYQYQNESMEVWGDGSPIRDFIHSDVGEV